MKTVKILAVISLSALCLSASGQTTRQHTGRPVRATSGTINRAATTNSGTISVTGNTREEKVNSYLQGLGSYESKSALTKTPVSDEKMPPVIVNNMGEAFILQTTTKNINDPGNEEIFASDQSTIFPGAIVFADKDLADGRPTLVGLDYGTVDLEIEFDTGGTTYARDVPNDKASINSAIYKLLRDGNPGYAPSVSLNQKSSTVTSMSKMSWDLGVDVKYLKNQVKVDTKTSNSESKIVKVQDFTQKYYTVSITPYSINNLHKYFGPNTTVDQLKSRVGNKPLAVINSVTYGRRIYYFEEYKTSDFTFTGKQSVKASIGGVDVNTTSSQDIANSSKTDNKWLYILGGSNKPAQDVMSGKSVTQAFASEGALEIGPKNQGVAIWYSARFLSGGRAISAKASGTYTETSYVKCPKTVRWEIKNRANTAGPCVKFKAMYNVICVTGNASSGYQYEIVKGKGSGEGRFADYIENTYSNNTQKTRTMPTDDIEDYKLSNGQKVKIDNCFVLGPVHYTIRAKTADVAGVKWHQDEEGDFDISSGSVRVYMNGSALAGGKGVYIHSDTKPLPIGK